MTYELLEKLQKLNKDYLSIRDLEKLFDQRPPTINISLNRLVKSGWLKRLRRGIYQLTLSNLEIDKIANQLYLPSYLSFEYALAKYGVIDQIPYTITFATTNKTKKILIKETNIEFRQINKKLFFGYELKDGLFVASPEKALLDQLYLVSRGKAYLNFDELNLKKISYKKFLELSKKFPTPTQRLIGKLKK